MTDNFIIFRDLITQHIEKMMAENTHLYTINIDKNVLVDIYLDTIPKDMNPVFRERREHDCSCCRGFIKAVGGMIAIKDGVVTSVWDVDVSGTGYEKVLQAMSDYVHNNVGNICDIYLASQAKMGCHHNFEMLEKMGPYQWDHFYVQLNDKFVVTNKALRNEMLSKVRSGVQSFSHGLKLISLDALDIVLELIGSNSLYRGQEWKEQLTLFRNLKMTFDQIEDETAQKLFLWENAVSVGDAMLHLVNTAIGSLLKDISQGMDLNDAVVRYESITSANRYKRSTPVYTQKMLDNAKRKISEMGFMDSIPRRFATTRDLTVNDTLFVDRTVATQMKGDDLWSQLSNTATEKKPKTFSGVQEVSAEQFLADILPGLNGLEVFVENQHMRNLVSLIAPINNGSRSMFKWGNNFSWAYTGNVTDTIKANVAKAGGAIDGDLRFSIQWNDTGDDNCDLDAHCEEPDGKEINFKCKKSLSTGGHLDVDIMRPEGNVAVENITWANIGSMKNGTYRFYVHCYSKGCRHGFSAQVEILGVIHQFNYPHGIMIDDKVPVAEVTLANGNFTIKPLLQTGQVAQKSQTDWGITTNGFVPVSLVCFSPNYWETANRQEGHRHLFFMLKGCVNNENPSGIFNEYLVNDLLPHRKVMEGIANAMRLEDCPDQLSGIGFALDKRAELVVKAIGTTERIFRIKF